MDFINQAMLYLLTALHGLTNNYGLAIILLTVLIRGILWPLNSQQTRSMRKMQELQPKLKELQDKYKDNPQKMQEVMMKFYAENKFNPFAGCLPLIVQLPIFIGLFGALNSPQFLALTVNENFLFVDRLYHTLQSHAGEPLDKRFSVLPDDQFATANQATVRYKNGETSQIHVADGRKILKVSPKPLIPGEPAVFRFDIEALGFDEAHIARIEALDVLVTNEKSKELERVTFKPNSKERFVAEVPTVAGKNTLDTDVLILILAYGLLTLLYQKVMTPAKKSADGAAPDPNAQMMKLMPLMFVGVMFFIPMPAGVLLYLVATTALMFIQTAVVNAQEDKRNSGGSGKPGSQVVDVKADKS